MALDGELLRCVGDLCPPADTHRSRCVGTGKRRVSVPVALVFANALSYTVHGTGSLHYYAGLMTKLNLVNKHWLNIQCSACRHDVSVPVQRFIDLGVNDIFEVKAKSKCKRCGRKGDAEIVIYYRNEYDVEREKNAASDEDTAVESEAK